MTGFHRFSEFIETLLSISLLTGLLAFFILCLHFIKLKTEAQGSGLFTPSRRKVQWVKQVIMVANQFYRIFHSINSKIFHLQENKLHF